MTDETRRAPAFAGFIDDPVGGTLDQWQQFKADMLKLPLTEVVFENIRMADHKISELAAKDRLPREQTLTGKKPGSAS